MVLLTARMMQVRPRMRARGFTSSESGSGSGTDVGVGVVCWWGAPSSTPSFVLKGQAKSDQACFVHAHSICSTPYCMAQRGSAGAESRLKP